MVGRASKSRAGLLLGGDSERLSNFGRGKDGTVGDLFVIMSLLEEEEEEEEEEGTGIGSGGEEAEAGGWVSERARVEARGGAWGMYEWGTEGCRRGEVILRWYLSQRKTVFGGL